MPQPIATILEVATRGWSGSLGHAGSKLADFEDELDDLESIPGVRVRMPKRGASESMFKAADVRGVAREALLNTGSLVIIEAQVLVPKDTLTLARSAEMEGPELEGPFKMRVTLIFGADGVNPRSGQHVSDYALYVHEDPEAHHAPPTQFKFLEQPTRDATDKLAAAVLDELWDRLEDAQ